MTKRMLIDATDAEETRVVVLDGNRLEDFDVETAGKRQLKGNIYLAKVVRVEPSLQAAFVEYGGNRHGFLAFSEIHPDYYQIPIADRQRLLELQAEQALAEAEAEDRAAEAESASAEAEAASEAAAEGDDAGREATMEEQAPAEPEIAGGDESAQDEGAREEGAQGEGAQGEVPEPSSVSEPPEPSFLGDEASAARAQTLEIAAETITATEPAAAEESQGEERSAGEAAEVEVAAEAMVPHDAITGAITSDERVDADTLVAEPTGADAGEVAAEAAAEAEIHSEPVAELPPPETIGGDHEEPRERRIPPQFLRNYKIQEVIKRRQILLVQVVKEERGTKGAALTTYLSLAGRYCVLMPNSPRGGGISRKITSAADRRRLKEIMAELEIPPGMGLIVRTAGANRPKQDIKRDCEYLLRLWDDIREHTLKSVAPALIYEEANLIKRAIRDVYSRDVDEILVDGESGWRAAHEFMRMLMPSHARKVQLWRDGGQPLFARHQVDVQLDAMLQPTVQLRSGGYLVINQAEALVAIDVNSGRSTRERNIEETALRTNLEAADEVARQLRLRDLAGLIVIDFIDMESKKHNAMVERRLKEALKNDRARIQVGHISHFGLLEMSRQRLRPSLAETSFNPCPLCGGTGHVRSTESSAVHVLRQIEDEGARRRSAEIVVNAATPVALYILNHKRDRVRAIEARYAMRVAFAADDTLFGSACRIERVRAQVLSEVPVAITPDVSTRPAMAEAEELEEDEDSDDEEGAETQGEENGEEGESRRRRRKRRRRGRREDEGASPEIAEQSTEQTEAVEEARLADHVEGVPEHAEEEAGDEGDGPVRDEESREARRRRGRRGGRRRRREEEGVLPPLAEPGADQPEVPAYRGPTPADPFGGAGFDIFEVIERAEQSRRFEPTPPLAEASEPHAAAIPPVAEQAEAAEPVQTEGAEPPHEGEPVGGATEFPPVTSGEGQGEEAAPAAPEPAPQLEESAAREPAPPTPEPEERLEPANDTAPEPVIKPIVIGSGAEPPVVEKKRGWWRR
jgi:ribonuclease E